MAAATKSPAPRKTIASLATSTALLAILSWHLQTTPADTSPIAFAPPATPPAQAVTARQAGADDAAALSGEREPDAVALAETLERPLMRPGRRPWVAPPVAQAAADETGTQAPPATADLDQPPEQAEPLPPLPEDLVLVGIIATGAQDRRVLLRTAQHPVARWLRQGESLNGWVIAAIEPASVTFAAHGERAVLDLYAAAEATPATTAGAQPAAKAKEP